MPRFLSMPAWKGRLLALALVAAGAVTARAQAVPAGQGQVADTTELRALQALYTSTGGPAWPRRTNWPTAAAPWSAALGSADFARWYGVTVTNGDVTALQLAGNGLAGTLPAEVGLLAQLRTLNLGNNALGGGLPDELGQALGLQTLDLRNNQFEGNLPAVAGLRQLQTLRLQDNRFSGPLPAGLGQCWELRTVQLSNNLLTGDLPASLGRLARLTALYLDRNRFAGALPDSLARLTALGTLALNDNRFTGPIPAAWQQLAALNLLQLDNNRLTGPLPAGVVALPRLTLLTLSNNHLNGTIPAFLGTNGGFADFSGNDFTGLAPYAAVAAYGAKYVFVDNNYLDFGALEPSFTPAGAAAYAVFAYSPQRALTPADTARYVRGGTLQLHRLVTGAFTNPPQWEREVGNPGVALWTPVPGATGADYVLPNATEAAQGLYRLVLTNALVSGLTLSLRAAYADLVPYAPLPENRPVEVGPQALATAFAPTSRGAATDSVNYVRTFAARAAYTDPARLVQAVVDSVQVRTEYLDGLGRPVQTVLRQESPGRRDLVQPMAYDALGRQPRQYLPYVAANPTGAAGEYRPDAIYAQYHFYRDNLTGPGAPTDGVVRTGVPFGETAFEASPLDRVLAQAAAGESWQMATGRVVSRLERPNLATDSIQSFVPGDAPNSSDLTPTTGGYAAGELWSTQTTDEQVGPDGTGYRTIEWKDKLGQTVLKQVEAKRVGVGTAARSRWLRTYYAYDDFGHLRAVLPPEAVKAVQANAWAVNAAAEKFLYRYRYDGRGRVVAKQVPGTEGETWVVYNLLDQPVLTQDAAQRGRGEWSFVKYDALGRPVLTGLVTRSGNPVPADLQAEADATAGQFEQRSDNTAGTYPQYYTTDQAYPRLGQQGFSAGQIMTATSYDDDDFNNDGAADVAYDTQLDAQLSVAPVPDTRTTGQVTRTLTRVLGVAATAPGAWLTATTFYDERARPVQVQATNARGGQDLVTSQLDFTGKVVKSVALHHGPSLPAAGLQVAETMSYDHAGRLLTTRQQLPDEAQPALIASLVYNELGQLTRKSIGTGALLQNVDYAYNVRGWLTGLNDPGLSEPSDLFGLALCYERGFTGGYEQYNGNITGQKWRSKRDGVERAYGYAYDPLNRLLQGDYVARAGTGTAAPWTAEAGNYRLYGTSYDDNGNLLTLRRRGLLASATRLAPKQYGPVDLLTYRYDGNRLQAVDDQVTTNQLPRPAGYHGAPTSLAGDFQEQGVRQQQEYFYDANGSLTQDRNKGISGIGYNHLNLPKLIHFGTGADSLVFRYTAAGQKVAKLVYQSGQPVRRTDYLGPYQYEQDSLRFFPHAEGRVLRFANTTSGAVRYEREYTLKDHLGNLRLAYRLGQRLTYTATLEQDAATHGRERQQFDSLSVSPPVAQNVGGRARTGGYVAQLNAGGTAPRPLGPLTQLAVQKGDTVTVTAPGYYPQPVQSFGFAFSLASFVAGLLQQQPPTPGGLDGRGRTQPLPLLSIGVSAGLPALVPARGGVPKGYVRLLVFDADSNLVGSQTRQLSSAARTGYEPLSVQVVVAQDAGGGLSGAGCALGAVLN